MRYAALALDFDGTLATGGVVPRPVVRALERARNAGRALILVTGRKLPSLKATFGELALFDRVLVENGALLYVPATGNEVPLATAPPRTFVDALLRRSVRLSVGAVVVSSWEPHLAVVREVIAGSGLALDIARDKRALMILPSGVDKGTGVTRAASDLHLDLRHVVGIGDGENDGALLRACGLGLATANAVSGLKRQADAVTLAARGAGVIEAVESLLGDELASFPPRARSPKTVAAVSAL